MSESVEKSLNTSLFSFWESKSDKSYSHQTEHCKLPVRTIDLWIAGLQPKQKMVCPSWQKGMLRELLAFPRCLFPTNYYSRHSNTLRFICLECRRYSLFKTNVIVHCFIFGWFYYLDLKNTKTKKTTCIMYKYLHTDRV